MFRYKLLLCLLLPLLPLLAKKATSLEGVWKTQTIKGKKVANGLAIFTKDSLITYNNSEEDSRVAYTLKGDTITIDGSNGVATISSDTLTLQVLNYRKSLDTLTFKRVTLRDLPRSSRKLIKKISGEWYLYGFTDDDSLRLTDRDKTTRVVFTPFTVEIYEDDERLQSNSYTVEENQLRVQSAKVSLEYMGDTLKLTSTEEKESLLLIPIEMAPPVDSQLILDKESCLTALKTVRSLIDQAVLYESEHGEFANSFEKLKGDVEIPAESKWSYTYSIADNNVTVRATLKEGQQIGQIESGNYFELCSRSRGTYSHSDFKKVYLKYNLYRADLLE